MCVAHQEGEKCWVLLPTPSVALAKSAALPEWGPRVKIEEIKEEEEKKEEETPRRISIEEVEEEGTLSPAQMKTLNPVKELLGFAEPAFPPASDEFVSEIEKRYSAGKMEMSWPLSLKEVSYDVGEHEVFYFADDDAVLTAAASIAKAKEATVWELENVWYLCGDPSSDRSFADVMRLQNDPFFEGALFQIASNFNSLEQKYADEVPLPVSEYVHDRTQGPRAVLATTASILYRRYLIGSNRDRRPDVQETYKNYPGIFAKLRVGNAYDDADLSIGGYFDVGTILKSDEDDNYVATGLRLARGFGIMGVRGCDVVLNWPDYDRPSVQNPPGKKVGHALVAAIDATQEKMSTLPLEESNAWLFGSLFAAYYNTLAYAVRINAKKVVLTLMGGGVFSNPPRLIAEAMQLAILTAKRIFGQRFDGEEEGLTVYVNLYNATDNPTSPADMGPAIWKEIKAWTMIRHDEKKELHSSYSG